MANIFQLYGSIFIDNEKANSSIDETTKKGEDAAKKTSLSFGDIAKGAAAVGTAVVGAATTLGKGAYDMANNLADRADEVDKMSQKLGMSTEAYQTWDYVLGQAGVDINNMSTGMKTLTNKLDQAKSGSTKAQETFAKLGLSLKDLENMSREDVFAAVVEGFQGLEDTTERAAIANSLFGKSGQELIPLFNASAEATAELKDQAKELGFILSEEDVNAGAHFKDTMDTLTRSFDGMKNAIAAEVLPIVQTFADKILEMMPKIQSILAKVIPIVVNLLEQIAPPLFDLVDQILPMVIDLVNAILPLLSEIITAILPVVISLIQAFLPIITQIVEGILPVIVSILDMLMPLLNVVIETILPIIISLLDTLLPVIFPIVQEILPIILELMGPILSLLELILPPLSDLIETVIPLLADLLKNLAEKVMPVVGEVFEVVADLVSGYFTDVFETISPLFEDIKHILTDVIDFVSNVFKGDWSAAWDSIKKIFVDIWNGIKDAVKVPINFIIDGVNMLIRGLNSISVDIPDWVPGLGGQKFGFNLSEIAHLRRGMEYVPYDEFPALLHKGERVLTASEAKEQKESDGKTEKIQTVSISMPINIEKLEVKDGQDINVLAEELMEAMQEKIERKGVIFA